MPILGIIASGVTASVASTLSSYFLGGGSDKIEQLQYSNETITTLAAVLNANTTFAGGHSNNGVKGYTAGGDGSTTVRTFTYQTQTASTTTGMPVTLDRSCYNFANTGVAGYVFGGDQTAIFKQAYSNDSVSTLAATFPRASNQRMGAGSNNGVAGYLYGGSNGANPPSYGDTSIHKILFSNDTFSTLGAVLSNPVRTAGAAADSGTATYNFGGYVQGVGGILTTDKITFSTEATSIVGGNMASTLLAVSPGCSSNNGVAAYIAAGEDLGGTGAKNQVGKFAYSTATHTVIAATTWDSVTAQQGKTSVADCAAN
jgi:hypothetical protein